MLPDFAGLKPGASTADRTFLLQPSIALRKGEKSAGAKAQLLSGFVGTSKLVP
jgi:hypothetical protein